MPGTAAGVHKGHPVPGTRAVPSRTPGPGGARRCPRGAIPARRHRAPAGPACPAGQRGPARPDSGDAGPVRVARRPAGGSGSTHPGTAGPRSRGGRSGSRQEQAAGSVAGREGGRFRPAGAVSSRLGTSSRPPLRVPESGPLPDFGTHHPAKPVTSPNRRSPISGCGSLPEAPIPSPAPFALQTAAETPKSTPRFWALFERSVTGLLPCRPAGRRSPRKLATRKAHPESQP